MALFFFLLLTLFWGCSFIAIRFSLEGFPPFVAAGLRILIATLFFCALVVARRTPSGSAKGAIWRLIGVGILNFAFPWACLFWGEQTVSPALASILNSTMPIWVLLCAWMLLPDEPPTWLKGVGVAIGFLGISLVFAPGLEGGENIAGMAVILLMAVSYALGAVLTRKIALAIDIRWSLIIQGTASALLLFALSVPTEGLGWTSSIWQNPKAIWGILYLGVFSTALAWLMYFRLIRDWGALRASSVTYAMPFVSIAADWLYFRKIPSHTQLAGAGAILSGLSLIHWARVKEIRRRRALSAGSKSAAPAS
ncbi:MAG: DMT family transporter [Pseudomonadota bacterium]